MEDSFDFDMSIEELCRIQVLLMDRDQPDVSLRYVGGDDDASVEISKEFGHAEYLQLVMLNNDPETRDMCPYFRVVMDTFKASEPVNLHLKRFYERIGMSTLSANCKKAMVLGMYDIGNIGRVISVPTDLTSGYIDLQDRGLLVEEMDSDCLQPLKTVLYGVEGVCLPYHVPIEAQWKILSFLRNPLAQLVLDQMDELCRAWDVFLYPMFQQREPRIPAHVAYTYSAPTVLTTVGGATKSFLAPRVKGWDGFVYLV